MAIDPKFTTNLKLLHEESWFQAYVKTDLLPSMPEMPEQFKGSTPEEIAIEAVKAAYMRQGYKYCLAKLGVKYGR